MARRKTFYTSVPANRLRSLAKSERDYSKPTLNEIVEEARRSNKRKKPQEWVRIVSVPMGGMNKR